MLSNGAMENKVHVFWLDHDAPVCSLLFLTNHGTDPYEVSRQITSKPEWRNGMLGVNNLEYIGDLTGEGKTAALALLDRRPARELKDDAFKVIQHLGGLPQLLGRRMPVDRVDLTPRMVVLYSRETRTAMVREDFTTLDRELLDHFEDVKVVRLPATIDTDILAKVLRDRSFKDVSEVEGVIEKVAALADATPRIAKQDIDFKKEASRVTNWLLATYSITMQQDDTVKASELCKELQGRIGIADGLEAHGFYHRLGGYIDGLELGRVWRPDGLYFVGLKRKELYTINESMLDELVRQREADMADFLAKREADLFARREAYLLAKREADAVEQLKKLTSEPRVVLLHNVADVREWNADDVSNDEQHAPAFVMERLVDSAMM